MSDVDEDTKLENLFDLYTAECDRDKLTPTIRDFNIWLSEKGYEDDLSEIYQMGEDGQS